MSNKIQIRRGIAAGRPTLDSGEPGLDTDAVRAWIGTTEGNRELQMKGSTTDYTIYVATSTYGGVPSSSGATGKAILTGSADVGTGGTTLYDAAGTFTSAAHLNKAIYNATTGVWSKVASVSSSTNLTLSVSGSFAAGDTYVITNAFDNIPEAFNVADAGYNANITLRVSDGTFSNVLTLIGKTAGAAKTLTMQGSTTGTTTVSGETSIYQKISIKNITFTKRIFEYFGADVDWTTCVTSGDDGFLLLKSTSVANTFRTSSVIVFENDPAVYTSISSTVTKGYTIYVATSTYGGSDAVGDGLKITQGSATSTSANKLVDSTANFNSTDHLNKTLYNSTDDTWAQITAIDSTTQVSISADIMASGEAYVIANAVATIQKGIDLIPGAVNCNTTVKASDGTYTAGTKIQGKALTGAYNINVEGTMSAALSSGTSTGANVNLSMGGAGVGIVQATLNDTGKAWTATSLIAGTDGRDFICIKSHTSTAADRPVSGANWRTYWSYAGSSGLGAGWVVTTAYAPGAYDNKMIVITGGTGVGQWRVIDWTKATQLKIVGLWDTLPDATSTYKIIDWATIVDLSAIAVSSPTDCIELIGQQGVILKKLFLKEWPSNSPTSSRYGIYIHDFSQCSLFDIGMTRTRTDGVGDFIQLETASSLVDAQRLCCYESAAWTTFLFRSMFGAALKAGGMVSHSKFMGGNNCVIISSGSQQSTGASIGNSIVLRNARGNGWMSNSFSRTDLAGTMITCCGTTGMNCSNFGYFIIRSNVEVSYSVSDGVKNDAYGQPYFVGSSNQVNYNGGWGVNTINLSYGTLVSTLSYTGNASGTYTADASSKNT